MLYLKKCIVFVLLLCFMPIYSQQAQESIITGKILSTQNDVIDFATVYLKNTNYGATTNQDGVYNINAPAGKYTLIVSAIGYKNVEKHITLVAGSTVKQNIAINQEATDLQEVTVVSNGISRLQRSAYNAVAIDTKALQNSTLNISDALGKAPGLKVRESGGVGSDLKLMMDGFTGDHVKVFIDGVPQEGVGTSFGLNNIPVNYAERIEVYRGVVPVGFGTDAIAGVINIVTKKEPKKWFADASYSYGSFNTHKSYVNFAQTLDNGFSYEVNAFQNYSDNSYYIDTPVEIFGPNGTSEWDESKIEHVKRFHDTFHNEAVSGKVGFVGKKWADRLMIGFTYSNMYKEIQNGVIQKVVYGDKLKKGHSLMPSLEYSKRDLLKGLDVVLTANYNKNITYNIDTSSYKYNWHGDRVYREARPGEQNYQHNRADENNWNGTFTANYRIGTSHLFTANHVINSFSRSNESLLVGGSGKNPIKKESRKNISGLAYRLMPMEQWNLSVFAKYYNQHIAGPVATTGNQDKFKRVTNNVDKLGYGAAGTYFIIKPLQAKLSYEKTYRLPTDEEVFGDEDLEKGEIGLKPESSDNINFNLSYTEVFGKHQLYLEGGLIYRNTKDFIRRDVNPGSGGSGKTYGTYVNHDGVLTKGYNISVRYSFADWLSVGGNFTQMNARDNVKTATSGSTQTSVYYKARMKNVPYQFANSDITLHWRKLWKPENVLTMTYDNFYLHSFPLHWENVGSTGKDIVPTQFSHNLTVSYAMNNGRYNLSFECRNFTDEKVYDNFSLQKAGRAFYGKVRVYFGN